MKKIIIGILLGFMVAFAIGTSAGSMFYVLRKVAEHDKIFNNHAQGIQALWDITFPPDAKKKRR